jgi:hypothetical protein
VFPAPISVSRLLVHGLAAWVVSALLLGILISTFSLSLASGLYTFGAPALTVFVAAHYFRRGHAEEPLIAAIGFTAVAAALDLLVSIGARGKMELMDPAIGFGLSLLLVFGATGFVGEVILQPDGKH